MKRTASLLAAVLAVCALHAQGADNATLPLKLGETWRVFLNVEPPVSYDVVPASLKTPEGKPVEAKIVKLKDATIDLAALNGGFQAGGRAVLYNEFHSEKAGVMRAGAGADWWMEIHVNGKAVCSTMANGNGAGTFKPGDHVFSFPVVTGKNLLAANVKSGSAGWCFVCGTPEPKGHNLKFEANSEWKAIDMAEVRVKAGSALDQRSLAALPPRGGLLAWLGLGSADKRLPRLGVGPTGKLVIEGDDVPVRLRGTGTNTPWLFGRAGKDPDWKGTWRDNAIAARLQGYNLVRSAFDAMSKEDLSLSPEFLDKADYLTSQLGEQGIYSFLTIGSYGLYLKNAWGPLKKGERRDYCLRMYLGDEQIRKAWKYGADILMNHVNPYTGLAWKDDPNIACVELFNEQEWGLFRPNTPDTMAELDARFQAWLEAKYTTTDALAKAWNAAPLSSFQQVVAPKEFPFWNKDAKSNDYILFCMELSRQNIEWMEKTLRATGYKGLIGQYNISHWLGGQVAKYESSQVALANTYHNHPTDFDNPGSKCAQNSSVATAGAYWRGVASMRVADRPFIETEFNHAFWNPYQYECGPLFGAYSALQGLDALMIHGDAAFFHVDKPALGTFTVGRSPVSRAGEFLSGCLYLRGDVKASPHRVELDIPKEYLETDCNGGRAVSTEQNKLALLTGFSVAFPWAKRPEGVGNPAKPDLVMPPAGGAGFKSAGGGWAVDAVESKDVKFSLDAAVASLKAKGILPKSNLSDPAKGVFQSDTGEIIMRTKENLLKIVTPRSEAVTLESGKGESVGQLEVVNTSAPSLVAACAVDQEQLAESGRVVLIYSTEAVNSGMELSADRTTLVKLGGLPVLAKTGKLDVKLKNVNGAAMSLYALGFDGSRRERLPLTFKDGVLTVSIDTAALKDGPTPFFELVVEN